MSAMYDRMVAKLEAEESARRAWFEELAMKYGVVRLVESLSPEEWDRQRQWVEFRPGRRFLTTVPHVGMMMDADGTWHLTEPL